jgi:MinD-like ATPase involved in chromosome partitioning or flagellar assembly
MVVNAPSGTELEGVELVVVLAEDDVLVVVPTPDVSAVEGALSTLEDGVYLIELVVALEPADDEPEDAYEDDAPGPDPPDEAAL